MKEIIYNEKINSKTVYLVIDNMEEPVSIKKSLAMAYEQDMDLVQVAIKNDIPVCKIMDKNKYVYNLKKKQKKNVHKPKEKKEVRFSASIQDFDLMVKENNIRRLLRKGHEVKVTLYLRGRERGNKDYYVPKMKKVLEDLKDDAVVVRKMKVTETSIFVVLKKK